MEEIIAKVIQKLIEYNKTISAMESCTGGGVANAITNIAGASDVLSFSAVTYSNEYKIKMGVPKETIDLYTVYSQETADAMSKAISDFTDSSYGVGITGKLNRTDKNNLTNQDNIVYISIYNKEKNIYIRQSLSVSSISRSENKQVIIQMIMHLLWQDMEN